MENSSRRYRGYLTLPGRQEELIRRVAATGKPVVVVLIGGSAIVMSEWLDQVPAVLNAWYPGDFRLMIGRSCKDIRLQEVIRVGE